LGSALGLPFAGVHIVEASKQVYRPVGVRRVARRQTLALQPGLAPAGHPRSAHRSPLSRLAGHAFYAAPLSPET
ncbi:MAG: hypothetical protein JO234_15160, partial [Hyphomicrobiales bacterium]|nr:hypothetical protein [Hyphomicrobiales bacterium]